MAIYQLGDDVPKVDSTAYVAKEATVVGQVEIGPRSTVWAGAVIRGDNAPIQIGAESSIQDGSVLHVDQGCPLTIGDHVTIGHQVMLHGCTIGEGTLIGIQAVVLNRAVIGKDCLVGAGAIVTEGKTFPDRSLILGVPAKVVRELTDEDIAKIRHGAANYAAKAEIFNKTLKKIAD